MYHGLDTGEPMTHREVAAALNIGPMRVRALAEAAVAQLLGRPRPDEESAQRRRVAITAVCPVCGRGFSTAGRQRYCSEACRIRVRVQGLRPDLAALRALDAEAFSALPPAERTVVGMYCGLDGREPMGVHAIEAALHVGRGRVGALLKTAVARLLNPSRSSGGDTRRSGAHAH
jgi:DNA-directed RNA polymerase sigma subunit (sigma70/sigma32)